MRDVGVTHKVVIMVKYDWVVDKSLVTRVFGHIMCLILVWAILCVETQLKAQY